MKEKFRFASLYLLAWTPFTALYAVALIAREELTAGRAAMAAVASVLPAVVLGVAVWYLAVRMRGTALTGMQQSLLHIVLAVVFACIWLGTTVAQIATTAPREALESFMASAVPWQLLLGVVCYAAIASVAVMVTALQRVRDREAATIRAEGQRAVAELHALRARLDPHFLFNTLHSVTELIRVDPAAAEQAMQSLAELLRYVLDIDRRGVDDVALADEMAFVRQYLSLERMRLGSRLEYVEEIDPDALECLIPALTVQPLVENAIRHGLAPLARGGVLRVSASLRDERLILEIGDNGAGAATERLFTGGGIGLSTVKRRIEARFPQSVVECITAPQEGFLVRINIPVSVSGIARSIRRNMPELTPTAATLDA